MPFTSGDIARRREVLAKRGAADALARAKYAEVELERQRTVAMLEREYSSIPLGDAVRLWDIATQLTRQLVNQFIHGEDRLESEQDDWVSLFVQQRSPYAGVAEVDKGYAAVLTQMARQYNDISQTLTIRVLARGELNQDYHGPRARVTATITDKLPD